MQNHQKLRDIDDLAYATTESPAITPIRVEDVLEIYEQAAECFINRHAEPAWNTLVHYPLFALALPKRDRHLCMIRPIPW